ncbi:hypothetical protein ACQ3I4_01595 [Zafaria sp. Z1313]|uniref:hypothetical protein n=1 Tax=unclassified Zafaria TaxID=2828765 RepID=UPI002E77E397|nr:hypothetical protein [Zafaria sp. J156]MEE1620069.1 hypothetical protein [Zafaria sp. J156]
MSRPARPERVRVTAPADARVPRTGRGAADPSGDFYVRSLIRSQLRLALSVAIGFLLLLVGLAVLVAAWPQIHDIRLLTVPLPWLVLGIGVYPIILLGAFVYNRAAARNEERYRDLADPGGS